MLHFVLGEACSNPVQLSVLAATSSVGESKWFRKDQLVYMYQLLKVKHSDFINRY
jgi:hypothetical protein